MPETLTLLLNITAADPEQSERLNTALLRELRESDAVANAGLEQSAAPDGAKGAWSDWLKLQFTPQNLEKVFRLIKERLPGAPVIEMELEVKGKKIKLKTKNQEDFIAAMKLAQKFVRE